jgi:hypothetical protein
MGRSPVGVADVGRCLPGGRNSEQARPRCRSQCGLPLINADAKLGAYGPMPGYRTRARCVVPKRCAYRALYRQVGGVFVVAATGPEAQSDPRGFDRAVRRALQRLAKAEEG